MNTRQWVSVLLVLAVCMTATIWLRTAPVKERVLPESGELSLPETDPYFHYRQARHALNHFPHVLRWDAYTHYPSVMRSDAAGLYDIALAGAARIVSFTGMPKERALTLVSVWFPPIGAALVLPLVFLVLRRVSSPGIAAWMLLWVVLIPADSVIKTMFGFCDHHVVEMLLSVLAIWLWTRLVQSAPDSVHAWWEPAFGAAWPLAIIQFTWLGGPMYLPIFALALIGQCIADVCAGRDAGPTLRAGARFWLAFAILVAVPPLFNMEFALEPKLWRFTLLGSVSLLAALRAAIWWMETHAIAWKPRARLAVLGATATIATGATLWFITPARELLATMIAPKPTSVQEHVQVTWRYFFGATSAAGGLALLAPLFALLTGAWRRVGWWAAVLVSAGLVGLWARTYDYGYLAGLHAVLLAGAGWGALRGEHPDTVRPWNGFTLLAVLTIAVAVLAWPLKATLAFWLERPERGFLVHDGWQQAMSWLRTQTPAPVRGGADSDLPLGRAGVMTDWAMGNIVNTLGDRPATASRYPEADRLAPLFLAEESAVRAAPLGDATVQDAVRYVAADPRSIGDFFGGHLMTTGEDMRRFRGIELVRDVYGRSRLQTNLGDAYKATFAYRLLVNDGNGLSHFRLVYESPQRMELSLAMEKSTSRMRPVTRLIPAGERDEAPIVPPAGDVEMLFTHRLASVKLFEQVAGARLAGVAPAGAYITCELPLRAQSTGRRFVYRQTTRADEAGRYELVVPYATERVAISDVIAEGEAQVWGPDSVRRIQILESQVQAGERIELEAFRGGE